MPQSLRKKLMQQVRGPVFPLPTPFTKDGGVDHEALAAYVRFLTDAGAPAIMVTVGTSRFSVLTQAEMLAVNETAVRAAQGKAVTIVTTPPSGPTATAVEFARHAQDIGADAILGVFPDRFYGEDMVFDHFAAMADAVDIGVMLHLGPLQAGRGGMGPSVQYPLSLVQRLAVIPNLVGMKEESCDAGMQYAYNRALAEDFLIIGGAGGMRNYLTARQWGQRAYLVGIGNFAPSVELAFYAALERGDEETARQIVFELEEPFFRAAVPPGWHIALKEAMEACRLIAAHERAPMVRVAEKETAAVRTTARMIREAAKGMVA